MLLISSILIGQDDIGKKNLSIPALLPEEMTELELMLIADINTNETLSKFLKLTVISNSLKLNAPQYDRFAKKNNVGMLLKVNTSSSLYLDAGIQGWIEASKYVQQNNDNYSVGFFGSTGEKFSYYNSRKGYVDVDNYFKDSWDKRSTDDYIRYMHISPYMPDSEQNTIYDPNRTK
tara:strand:- start:3027 stop:3554 length:528 start_codon:yes stop_codon:yes gene_type:complete